MPSAANGDSEISVYHFGNTLLSPSPSSFSLKLMTYLRMTGIKYKSEHTMRSSSKGKMPFIGYKGKEFADSTFIIAFLNKEFDKNLDASLTPVEKAQALAFQRLCEENLYWTLVYQRWFDDFEGFSKQFVMGNFKRKMMSMYASVKLKPVYKSNLHGHGMGRHSKEEIYAIAEKDIEALSNFLAEKSFLMGEEPTEVDCAVFGLIAQFAYVMPGSLQEKLVTEKYPNLKAYADRMREKFWPDWEECCAHEKKDKNAPVEADAVNKEEVKDGETNGKEEEANGSGDAAKEVATEGQNGKSENAEAEQTEQQDDGAGDKPDEPVEPQENKEDAAQATS